MSSSSDKPAGTGAPLPKSVQSESPDTFPPAKLRPASTGPAMTHLPASRRSSPAHSHAPSMSGSFHANQHHYESESMYRENEDQDDDEDEDYHTEIQPLGLRKRKHQIRFERPFTMAGVGPGAGHPRGHFGRTGSRPLSDGDLVLTQDMSLKDRQNAINYSHPFGIRLWKPALYKKTRTVDNLTYQAIHEPVVESVDWFLYPGNFLWFLLFGWWMALSYLLTAGIMLLFTFNSEKGRSYVRVLLQMASYMMWPFGKFIQKMDRYRPSSHVGDHGAPLLTSQERVQDGDDTMSAAHSNRTGYSKSFSDIVFYGLFYTLMAPKHLFVSAICWMSILSIPMAKLNYQLLQHMRAYPLLLQTSSLHAPLLSDRSGEILLCTYRAFAFQYVKYTVDGINIVFINLLPVVFFALIAGYWIGPSNGHVGVGSPLSVFSLCLVSVIPLAYYIGMAVASISSQSSFGLGAVINASFGSIVEIILYIMAIIREKGSLVEGAIIGSFLGSLLLLPGVSMIAGGVGRWKEQRFNVKSAGVSTVLLIMALIGAFTPTLFYSVFGSYELNCEECPQITPTTDEIVLNPQLLSMSCKKCRYTLPYNPGTDSVYVNRVRPLMYLCAAVLPSAYIVGLLFTLRTHVKQIYDEDEQHSPKPLLDESKNSSFASPGTASVVTQPTAEPSEHDPQIIVDGDHDQSPIMEPDDHQAGGHDAPEWSNTKSTIILLVSTVIFSLLAELLVDAVDEVISHGGVDEKFLGLTLFALIPSVTEFVNAIAFAMYGNVALSLEIGSAYAVQIALIQIPCLVAFSAFWNRYHDVPDTLERSFTLIFPHWDVYAVFFGVFLLSYTYIEGKSNYFKGSILTLTYFTLLFSFYFAS